MNNLELANLALLIDEASWAMKIAFQLSNSAYIKIKSCGDATLTLYKKNGKEKLIRSFYSASGTFSENLSENSKKMALKLANNYEQQIGSGVKYTEIRPTPPNILVSIDDALYEFSQKAIPREV